MGLTSAPIDWYTARAAGIVAYIALSAVVLVGLTLSGQVRLPNWPKFALTDVHRFGGLIVGVFVSIHVATIALDSYTPFSLTQLVVPFSSGYRPLWTALGIVGAELLLAVAISNALRKRIPYRWWRRIHLVNFAVWGAATAHGIGAGTDAHTRWMLAVYIVSVSSVLSALVWRLARRRLGTPLLRGLAATAGLLGIAAVLALAAVPHGHTSAASLVAAPTTFADRFTGSIAQQNGSSGALVSVVGSGSGTRRVLVRIDLVTSDGQSITGTALQLKDLASGSVCSGTVSSVGSTGFVGDCSFVGGGSRTVAAVWQLSDGHVNGSLDVKA